MKKQYKDSVKLVSKRYPLKKIKVVDKQQTITHEIQIIKEQIVKEDDFYVDLS